MAETQYGLWIPDADGLLIARRHGAKASVPDTKPASARDKALVNISEAGAQKLREQGREYFGENPDVQSITVAVSDFIRTFQTAYHLLTGVNPEFAEQIVFEQRSGLGFSQNGIDWDHPELPKYSTEQPQADAYIKELFEKFYFQPSDPLKPHPAMAAIGRDAMNELVKLIERSQVDFRQKGKNLSLLISHAPVIDTIVAGLLSCIDYHVPLSERSDPTSYTNGNYAGHVSMNRLAVHGALRELASDNPQLELKVMGREKGYKLSDLKALAAIFGNHAELRYK